MELRQKHDQFERLSQKRYVGCFAHLPSQFELFEASPTNHDSQYREERPRPLSAVCASSSSLECCAAECRNEPHVIFTTGLSATTDDGIRKCSECECGKLHMGQAGEKLLKKKTRATMRNKAEVGCMQLSVEFAGFTQINNHRFQNKVTIF